MTKYFIYLIILTSVAFVGCSSAKVESMDTSESVDDGMPFGKITESDADKLMQFANEKGFDLNSELKKADAKDTNALSRVFVFSMVFNSMDQNARTYGQAIYSGFLNLAEAKGSEQYSSVVETQSAEVQQRIRDFLYYPVTLVPKKEQAQVDKEVREDFPRLFPKGYKFGHNDPLFTK